MDMDAPNTQTYPRAYSGYTLLESIGKGGMSAIDLAQTTVTDAHYVRFVVIKRMHTHLGETDEAYIRMFQDEARISAELQHANIAQVYNFGQYDNEFFMVMEYVPGVDLRELQKGLARQGKGIPIRITLKILYDILEALDYAHHRVDTFGQSLNIVHRDVNPRNVMLSIRGEVKLIDFGVAKADNRIDQTVGHTIKGKFAYMAPEQIDPDVGAVDGRADLFAVGLMLYELVAGHRPFHGLNEIQIMHKIMSVDVPNLPNAPDHPHPEQLVTIFNRVIIRDPAERYNTAGEMAIAIQQASMACGGMATSSEMAQFLKTNLPSRVETISARLNQYKTHATLTGQITPQIEPIPYSETTHSSAATTLKRERPSTDPSALMDEGTVELTTSVKRGWLALGGLLIFGLGFVGITQLAPQEPSLQMSPTEIVVDTTKETVSLTKDSMTKNPIEEQTNTQPIEAVQKPTIEQTKLETQTSSSRSVSSGTQSKSTKVKVSTKVQDKPKQTERTNAQTTISSSEKSVAQPQKSSTTSETPISVTPEIVKKIEQPKVEMHNFYLMVGVESGSRGLPVLYKGREITKTGATKSVTLPVGTIRLEIQDPKSGTSVFQSITVSKESPTITVQVRRM